MLRIIIKSVVVAFMCFSVFTTNASENSKFESALSAINSQNYKAYFAQQKLIKNRELKAILEGLYLNKSFEDQSKSKIANYIETNAHLYPAKRLRNKWLNQMLDDNQLSKFDEVYSSNEKYEPRIECVWHARNHKKSQVTQEQIDRLWRTTESRPSDCDQLFSKWKKSGQLTQDQIWQRVVLAMEARKSKLATFVANEYLSKNDASLVNSWQLAKSAKTGASLASRLDIALGKDNEAMNNAVITTVIDHFARVSPNHANKLWTEAKAKNSSLKKWNDAAMSQIASRAVLSETSDALAWVRKAPKLMNESASQVAVRGFLRQSSWSDVISTILKMPSETQQKTDWQYWLARAYEQTGKEEKAKTLYKGIAGGRGFYEFLASDKLGMDYQYQNAPPVFEHTKKMSSQKQFTATKDLLEAELYAQARIQWQHAIRNLSKQELSSAAKLASDYGFHDRAIITAGSAKIFDALEVRFPRAYLNSVKAASKQHDIPVELIYGIIRQESAFMDSVRSHAGALGLMQVMPATGKGIAKERGLTNYSTADLYKTDKNVDMGAYYISKRLRQYNNQYVVAIASYNAGAGNANRWLPKNKALDTDIWVETITYKETRKYVKRVLEYLTVYRYLMGEKEQKLSKLIGEKVQPKKS